MYEYSYGDRIIDGAGRIATVIDERRAFERYSDAERSGQYQDAAVNGLPLLVVYENDNFPMWIDGKHTQPIGVKL